MPTWDKDKMRIYMRKKRIQRKQEGLCVTCGARPARTGMVVCLKCSNRNLIANRKRRSKLKAEETKPLHSWDGKNIKEVGLTPLDEVYGRPKTIKKG